MADGKAIHWRRSQQRFVCLALYASDRRTNHELHTLRCMIAVSTVVMYGLMYLNTYELDHIFFSQTRVWMAVLMGAVMAVIMLAFMFSMYKNRRANAFILLGCLVVFCASLWLVRSQATVGDVSYMEAMIPHHSIAVLTSSNAHIKDPRVRKLADGIISTQVREIAEMKALIADIKAHPPAGNAPDLPPAPAN